jgi:glutamate-1-semialdehyde 2,1-aminomutase
MANFMRLSDPRVMSVCIAASRGADGAACVIDEAGLLALAAVGALAAPAVLRRLQLSRAKHPSLAGHARIASWLARRLPGRRYDEERFYRADDAPEDVVACRRAALARLGALYRQRFARTLEMTALAAQQLPDLQFTSAYRVPFQFVPVLREQLRVGAFWASSAGAVLTDADGNSLYDLTGSYGVNVFGNDFYKSCIDEGWARVRALGPVLGGLHPLVQDNARRLCALSGLDAVSFHMSGTEAVMQAVRLARYHTRKRCIVRFCGAYHGWWGEVQPGPGNPVPAGDTLTLRDMDERTLGVLRTRRDIACVLVNPLQALHPNRPAAGDSSLLDSARSAGVDRTAYAAWLARLREVCTERGIVLILDEVFVGFRIARGGAQEYFGVRADLLTWGKTLGGGLPVGVLCGRAELMRRYRDDRPADICFARGTFNSHPAVMGAMNVFLERLDEPAQQACYAGLDACWEQRLAIFNQRLREAGVPVQVVGLSSIWTVLYTRPARYNWMLQFYLRAHGIALSWVGTGRLIFPINMEERIFSEVLDGFVTACRQMQADGWWWSDGRASNRAIRRAVLRELLLR